MITDEQLIRYRTIAASCSHRLFGHPPLSMEQQLAAMMEEARAFPRPDVYGKGELIESLEVEMANLLGQEAAVFLPSGTMAQCIALRIWSDRAGKSAVGFHATSHLELHEFKAYQELHNLSGVILGEADRVVTLADLQAVKEPLAAVLLELPMREIGGQLPAWAELQAQADWLREQGIALHIDGARLWQCTTYYERSVAEIAGLADSVYVSFYKDIGGIAGSVLAGPAWFVAEARIWIRRSGGNLFSLFPYVLAARAGLKRNLAALPAAVKSAAWLAEFLNGIDGLKTVPLLPPTNLFHLQVDVEPQRLLAHACDWSERHGAVLLPPPRPGLDGGCFFELSLGRAVEAASRETWEAWLTDFFAGLG